MRFYTKDMHYSQCPFCQSDSIEAQQMEIPDGGETYQVVECHDCKKKWQDIYHLIGFEEITD